MQVSHAEEFQAVVNGTAVISWMSNRSFL